tara:strand:+ start:301 stop:1191 length:891 start_codon:yes stop_codon:yes gene_type:complete
MLLLDLSGVACAKPITLYYEGAKPPIEDVRNAMIGDIQEYEKLYSEAFGRMVVCIDSKPYWRSEVQPAYKQSRAKAKAKSDIDWDTFGADVNQIHKDLVEYSNYIVIDIQGAEADDVIAVLTEYATSIDEHTVIISSDKDMLQLQLRNKKAHQFSPNRNKLLTLENTEYDLLSHILKGDVSDCIPNVFSLDNHFMIEGDKPRQKSITKKIIAEAREYYPDNMDKCELLDETAQARFKQNQELIDTTYTPKVLQETIISMYIRKCAITKEHRIEELLSPFESEEDEVNEDKGKGVRL